MTDEFEVEVSSDGGKLAARGHSVERLADALVGFVSPVTEGAAAIGDVVRMYRQRSAIRGLARARELAHQLGVPIRPIEPKFLVNWVEGASLEEEGAPLMELWAGLLVSGARGLKPNHLRFQRMLREMTSRHYEFFRYLCDADSGFRGINFHGRLDRVESYKDEQRTTLSELPSVDDFVATANALEAPGLKAIQLDYGRTSLLGRILALEDRRGSGEFFPFFEDGTFGALKDAGLVAQGMLSFRENRDTEFATDFRGAVIHYVYISDLGIEFVEACSGGEASSSSPPDANQSA